MKLFTDAVGGTLEAIRLDAQWIDYLLIEIYFVFVLGIGWFAKRGVS